ncbi:hypothetical protein LOTGIDRAFT_231439 [Lottia gigantea]|uniref:Cytochrome P450 n=1 Tax=Lottia gigantea TaxID=225164 RepID=V4AXS0_LOTGI|nr:hypothetical protein LOTGIDRAFT_231439 [Lottia gigantea]ESO98396.1 hypothetical protein LOTGIDRAFT_231439 [Lottia gigantea]
MADNGTKHPPGSAGIPLLGDKSYDFYKDPPSFFEKNAKHYKSRVFLTRFLLKPTVFVGSSQGLIDIFADKDNCNELGYKTFLGQIFGENILFTDGKPAEQLREALFQLFTDDCIKTYQQTVDRIVDKAIQSLDTSKPLCIYAFFKRLVTEICLTLFLGLDFDEMKDLSETISSLTTTHWHGIISMPLSVKVPGLGSQSTYSKALQAKIELLKVIEARRKEDKKGFHVKLEEIDELDDSTINNHLLLFTSALVPKAISSLLTSFIVETGKPDKISWQKACLLDEEFHEHLLLEVQRFYPPFFGGRREVIKDFVVDGYTIPAGQSIVYSTTAAHRDPLVFNNPDQFYPGRWNTSNKEELKKKLFCFGKDNRSCVGDRLVWVIINTILKKMMTKYEWSLVENQDINYKWLPVSKPKSGVICQLTERSS